MPSSHSNISVVYDPQESRSRTSAHGPVAAFRMFGWPSEAWWREFNRLGCGEGLAYTVKSDGPFRSGYSFMIVAGFPADAEVMRRIISDVESRVSRTTAKMVQEDRQAELAAAAAEKRAAAEEQRMKALMDNINSQIMGRKGFEANVGDGDKVVAIAVVGGAIILCILLLIL